VEKWTTRESTASLTLGSISKDFKNEQKPAHPEMEEFYFAFRLFTIEYSDYF